MKAVVVHESLWGNTAAVARAIADGLGPEARALSTGEAGGTVIADAGLIVAGAPVIAFGLSSEKKRDDIRRSIQGDRIGTVVRTYATEPVTRRDLASPGKE